MSGGILTHTGADSPADSPPAGSFIAIEAPARCAGVWQLSAGGALTGAEDETFTGRVWVLAPPAAFLALCAGIAGWCREHPITDCVSERFGDYAVTRACGRGGAPLMWQQVFSVPLARWRRMITEVRLDG